MKAKLYDCFKNWMQYDSIWFYSDPHFGDKESQEFRKQGFGYEISDEEQVNRINAKVGKRDLLVILGDVGDVSYVSKLKAGYKVLIQGNHDKGKTNYQRAIIDGKDNQLFDEVYDGKLQIRKDIILSHEPVDDEFCFNIHGHKHPSIDEDKKSDFQKWFEAMGPRKNPIAFINGDLSLHASLMVSYQFLYAKSTENLHFNCCAEMIGFTPVNIGSFLTSGVLNNVTDMHRNVIDNRTDNKNLIKCVVCGHLFEPADHLQDTCDKCAMEIGEVLFKI